jgi:hypothetical protein
MVLLSMYLDSGFHQVSVHAYSRSKLAFTVQMVGITTLLVFLLAQSMIPQYLSS